MGSFIVILIAITAYCSETYCDIHPPIIAKSEGSKFVEKNEYAVDKEIFWRNSTPSRDKLAKLQHIEEESKSSVSTNSDTTKRKSRLLGSLAFLAGLSFGGIASAASSTVKSFAKIPQASVTFNLSPSKSSPYFATYYPYSLLPYPFLYPGSFGLVPMYDPAKSQTSSQDDLTPQVINLFDNKQPFVDGNQEYMNEEKKSGNNRSADDGEDEADDSTGFRAEDDRNAEEKIKRRGCKENQRKSGNFLKGSFRQRDNFQEDIDDSQAILDFRAANMTNMDTNNTKRQNSTMTVTTDPPLIHNTTYNNTEHPPVAGYYGGYPQDISHVELKPDSDAYQYHGHNHINYNLPYEQPANFYHDNVYSSPHANPYFSGSSDQINEYIGTDFNRLYTPEYQPSYVNGFRPLK